MKKGAIVLKFSFLLSVVQLLALPASAKEETILVGPGQTDCEEDLPTLKVAEENIINTKQEWDAFVSKNQFFVVGAADSKCRQCCNSEPLLRDLQDAIKDKSIFSYPEKNKKQKKIVRKEI